MTIFFRVKEDLKAYMVPFFAVVVYFILGNLLFGAVCPAVILTGFPCPGCGTTRAFLALLRLDFHSAYLMNPGCFPLSLFALYFFIQRYVLGKKVRFRKPILFVIVALMVIRYLYMMIWFFPSRPPFVYKENNVLAMLFSSFQLR